jgi:hypothetical protein
MDEAKTVYYGAWILTVCCFGVRQRHVVTGSLAFRLVVFRPARGAVLLLILF